MIDAAALHRRVCIADGHADSLMWNRDLTLASTEGQVDFPRLLEAGVDIQCFTIVTRGYPFIGGFPVFAAKRKWPAHARRGEWSRAQFQIDQLEAYCARSSGRAAICASREDLERNWEEGRLSAVIGIEGAHALEGQVERVAALHARGVRFMSLTHLSNNELGGSSFPLMGDRGLTPLGREVLEAMVDVGMTVDLAHASRRTAEEILAHPGVRPFCSHTGVQGARATWRNLSDDVLRKIADRGGVVGIIFATIYLGGRAMSDLVRHIEHAVNVMGEEGVGLGSDFDGMVPLPKGMRDVRDLFRVTEALAERGFPERRIEKILGTNFRRFLSDTLG